MTASSPPLTHQHRSWKLTLLVLVLFFLISLLTNIMGPLIPETIRSFKLSLAAAGLLPFAFFLSYGLVSIPAGMLGDRTSAKKVLLCALGLQLAGALLFPSMPSYATALVSFFLIGIGSAALQVIINPLLRVSGARSTTRSTRRWRSSSSGPRPFSPRNCTRTWC